MEKDWWQCVRLSEDFSGALRPSDGLASGPYTQVVHRVQGSVARDSQQSTLAGLPGLGERLGDPAERLQLHTGEHHD